MIMPSVILKPGRERSVIKRHPWIYSGAVQEVEGNPTSGDTVSILGSSGEALAIGAYSPKSQIRVRIWTWEPGMKIGVDFFRERLSRAISLRDSLVDTRYTNAFRLVHGESDGLPGLIVDSYANILVMQCLSWGIERWRDTLVDLLVELTGSTNLYERSDVDVRKLEGMSPRVGVLRGQITRGQVKVYEGELNYLVDIHNGHKTGFYLDQRSNRRKVGLLASGRNVLDCFAYTGGFTISALENGAKTITSIESSKDAISLLQVNLKLNHLDERQTNCIQGNVFKVLRKFRDENKKFDMIILDPPKLASSTAQVSRAARGYKDLNLLGLKLLNPGGLLVTFSCSGGITSDLFQKIVFGASVDAGIQAQIVDRLGQDSDHPIGLNFPEGEYLKGLILYIN